MLYFSLDNAFSKVYEYIPQEFSGRAMEAEGAS